MQNYSGFMGGLYAVAEWIMRFSIVNFLWIIINLPILLLTIMMVFAPSTVELVALSVPLIILLPLLFYPSTIAVYASARDWTMGKDTSSLLRTYWIYMKESYKKSVWAGILLTLIWIIWTIDFFYLKDQHSLFGIIMIIIGLALLVFTINYFCLSVHYFMTNKELFKNAFLITIGNPLHFFAVLLISASILYMSFRLWFLFPFFTVSVISFMTFFSFYRFTLKIEKKAQEFKNR
ncbi:putative membrane protein YesL [Salirhabdus euzebyi]|uniref:Putative membrane protein YesL n=1 Tax=Salirhabdus euzebyi TaxID=394506 RepID=A0A841Q499_9BACI|nr:DUF624 domain-containing protein [Salirhabdus euzebyi]MBB6453236.1 putative membrane protein YesL [Salirhabdus euzebyi]